MYVNAMRRPSIPHSVEGIRHPADLMHEARARERAGSLPEAIQHYESAIDLAQKVSEPNILAEALRRLAEVHYKRGESNLSLELCHRSFQQARAVGNYLLAADALNTLGVIEMMTGSAAAARVMFQQALELDGPAGALVARVEQNLGILSNIQGDFDEALAHYGRSLDAFQKAGDEYGCAMTYGNLGIASTQLGRFDEADRYFDLCGGIAERAGDAHLKGACLVNHADVHVARRNFEDARRLAESALAIFDQLGARGEKSEAYRVIGVVYRETGRPALAESRLRSAIELAVASGSTLKEAEASRELALLYQAMGRNQEALSLLNAAHRLFVQLDARVDLVNVGGKVSALESTYLALVREWVQSIESSDSYTFGHCGRVAENAVAIARALGLDEQEQTTIRVGAYLHDLGKVRVPHEILNKPGPLTRDEFEMVQMHTVWGTELLAEVEFPWDIKPIIRWHHEKYDGAGYPDRLRGNEIPLSAQIVGVADVYDALTSTRAYRSALGSADALVEISKCRGWWSEAVLEAALRALGALPTRLAAVPRRSREVGTSAQLRRSPRKSA